ncbi:MAG: hypothetical protein L6Q76_10560 [Polyangiaceae bacterium]|nr:hypothetical protein [Polyangiaceae bacterium]
MMKRTRCLAALAAAFLPAVGALSCSADTGELIVVVQTDMELPKDIDTVRIEITSFGIPYLQQSYENLGGDRGIKLPATLGITTDNDSSRPVNIRIIAFRDQQPRVLREATTTIPSDRIATFHMPFSFLCDGRAKESDGVIVNDGCATDETCVAGDCVPIKVDAPPADTYDESTIFGGGTGQGDGTCFDVVGCIEGGSLHTPVVRANPDAEGAAEKPEVCSIEVDPSAGDMNFAILTETSGMCGESGCFVALDGNSAAGWVRAGDQTTIVLPDAVCRMRGEKVRGVVAAPLKPGCPLKEVRTPTCGPWSSVGSEPAPSPASKPVAHASGQHNPSSVALSPTDVLWTSRGLFDATPAQQTRGTVKAAPIEPGSLREISSADAMSARDIVVSGGFAFFTIASASGGGGEIRRAALDTWEVTPLASAGAQNPEGLAANGARVFWTEFTSGEINSVDFDGNSPQLIAPPNAAKHPYGIVADNSIVCWTNEGTIHTIEMGATPDGSVECSFLAGGQGVLQVAGMQNTPRAVALDGGSLYWATFANGGALYRATIGADTVTADAEPIVTGLSFPNGIAVDGSHIYFTTWGDGGVHRIAKGATPGTQPEKLASNQRKPAEIAVNETLVFWVNEGSAVGSAEGAELVGDGAVMRLLK